MQLDAHNFFKTFNSIVASTPVKILAAVSGGVDSMVLCDLLLANKIYFEIAHVNYGLRGNESDLDQKIVEEFAQKNKIPFHLLKIVETDLPNIPQSGIQNRAREIRYDWFNKLLIENRCDFIAVAHHGDDQAETILHQFIRGGTFAALRGMKSQRGLIIRPLLFYTKKQILHYAEENKILWREDASNSKDIYTRNKIRNQIIPLAREINPAIVESIMQRSVLFAEAEELIRSSLKKEIDENVTVHDNQVAFAIDMITHHPYRHLLLWEILREFNFTPDQMQEVFLLVGSQSGSGVRSATHQLLRDRGRFIVYELPVKKDFSIQIDSFDFEIKTPFFLSGKIISVEDVKFGPDPSVAYPDADKMSLPLILRTWKEGDKFKPLGMTGHQKVSDFLIQQKVNIADKNDVVVLLSGDKIVWVCGMRISDEFKITSHTKTPLLLQFKK